MRRRGALWLIALALATVLALAGCGVGGSGSVDGAGYSYGLPDGWHEASDAQVQQLSPAADTIVVGDEIDGFATNINVLPTGPSGGEVDLESEVDQGIDLLRTQPEIFGFPSGTEVTVVAEPSSTTLDGEPALEYEFETDTGSQVLLQRQLATVSPDGMLLTVTASSTQEVDDRDQAYDHLKETWSWE